MSDVRFWDTSALVKIFDRRETGHRTALSLWSGPRSRGMEHAGSVLVAIEAVRKFYRVVPDHVGVLMDALRSLYLIPIDEAVLPIAWELAKRSRASGADTAIVAGAVLIKRKTADHVELVTSDKEQAALAQSEGVRSILLS